MKNIKTYEEFKYGITFKQHLRNQDLDLSDSIEFVCNYKNLIDLDGIDKYQNLEHIDIENNSLTSLESIGNLPKLKELSIRSNKITSLKGLEKLTELESLWCFNNKIKNLEGIENLTKLESLGLNSNQITSLKGIENLINLKRLHLERNVTLDWIDYIDKKGNTWYTVLPKSIIYINSEKFSSIRGYWDFIDENQPIAISRKFNF